MDRQIPSGKTERQHRHWQSTAENGSPAIRLGRVQEAEDDEAYLGAAAGCSDKAILMKTTVAIRMTEQVLGAVGRAAHVVRHSGSGGGDGKRVDGSWSRRR